MRLVLSARAQERLADIRDYSLFAWGRQTTRSYLRQFETTFLMLLDNPQAGRARPDIGPEFRSIPVGRHLIVYRIEGDDLNIVAIPHQAEDPSASP